MKTGSPLPRTSLLRRALLPHIAPLLGLLLIAGLPAAAAHAQTTDHIEAWTPPAEEPSERTAVEDWVNERFSGVVSIMADVLFFNVLPEGIRERLRPDAELAIFRVSAHHDALVGQVEGTAGGGLERHSGRLFAQDPDALVQAFATVDLPPNTRLLLEEVVSYEEGLGDRTRLGWHPVLVDTATSLDAELLEAASLLRVPGYERAMVRIDFREEGRDALAALTATPGRLAFVLNGEVFATPSFTDPLDAAAAVVRIERTGADDRHFREVRDLSHALRAPLQAPPRIPFIVLWLVIGAVFFTLRMGFVNIRAFGHAIAVVRGRYDSKDDEGEVSHFQALASALSATVGLGNIAGVAIAIAVGGPGAVFWMLVAAFFGMTSKFVECTLGQRYRSVDERGKVLGGPMMYLHFGLKERGLGGLGRVLAIVFMLFCIGGSFGGGNMFQVNQAYQAVDGVTPFAMNRSLFGLAFAVLVGVVIIGGIRRIGRAAASIVPLMCGLYLIGAAVVLLVNAHNVPYALFHIVADAFNPASVYGGAVGVIIVGFQRAAFSNEAGIGSAAIAHSAARTKEPVREGIVALLEPFIDTVIVCLATGLVIVVSGVLDTPEGVELAGSGALLTAAAFGTAMSWFPTLLAVAIALFAYSTMLSWSYYGERCWVGLFNGRGSNVYRVIFLVFIYIGAVADIGAVLDFSDLMILAMAFPNILGLYIMSKMVRGDLDVYLNKLKSGAFDSPPK